MKIPNILFNSWVISAANCGLLSNTMLSGNSYNFHILSLNNCASPSANVSSVVATKYVILDNLSQTTRIASFPVTSNNLVIKSTFRWVYDFSDTSLSFSFPVGAFVLFFICWHISYPFTYCSTSLVTSSH